MHSLEHINSGLRMFLRSVQVKAQGFNKLEGSAEEICEKIVKSCWNGRYFQVSRGNFPEFWTRDFGWCCASLLKLGCMKEVQSTLEYALGKFRKAGKVTTTISQNGAVYDFPCYSPDSLAFLLRSLRLAGSEHLVQDYKPFLEHEAGRFFRIAADRDTGLIKSNMFFSSIKDHAQRSCCCYDNVMAAMLSKDLDYFGLENPFKGYNLKRQLIEKFWNGSFFRDTLDTSYVSGDANVLPFWTGVITDRAMMKKAVASLQQEQLDKPIPLRYSNGQSKMKWFSFLSPNYEGNTVWTHLGPMFIEIVRKLDKKQAHQYLLQYAHMIERWKTYPEVLTRAGKPYSSAFYYSDEGMIWAAMYLSLI
jgi:hypothetical protein